MSTTGDPPNPDDRTPPERVPGTTPTHRLIGERHEALLKQVKKLVQKNRSRIRTQSQSTMEDFAWEIFQSTVAKVIQYHHRYDPALSFEAWFHGWAQLEVNHHLQKLYGRSKRHQTTHFGEGDEATVADHRAGGRAEDVYRMLDLQELAIQVKETARKLLPDDQYELFIDKFFHLKDNEELARARNSTKEQIAVRITRIKQAVAGAFPKESLDGML